MKVLTQAINNKGKRSGTAVRAKGQQRVTDILGAARALLIEDGYMQFSLRNIASRAGVHLSNLQYYFPGKDELIHGLMEFIANDYEEKYDEMFSKLPLDPELRFEAVIKYLIADIQNQKIRRFFIQFWALLESSDAHSGVLLNELYAFQIKLLFTMIGAINSKLSEGKLQQRTTMIAAMIEGMMLMILDADIKLAEGEASIETEMLRHIIGIAMAD